MSSFNQDNADSVACADREAIDVMELPANIGAAVDAWAHSRDMSRAEAICRLIELGLAVASHRSPHSPDRLDPFVLEDAAMRQIGELLDPSLDPAERERRIRRLIEGPPEFSEQRIDLPKHGK